MPSKVQLRSCAMAPVALCISQASDPPHFKTDSLRGEAAYTNTNPALKSARHLAAADGPVDRCRRATRCLLPVLYPVTQPRAVLEVRTPLPDPQARVLRRLPMPLAASDPKSVVGRLPVGSRRSDNFPISPGHHPHASIPLSAKSKFSSPPPPRATPAPGPELTGCVPRAGAQRLARSQRGRRRRLV